MMDRDRLASGRYVIWDPPADLTGIDLVVGHPGVIVDPAWQDVEVSWFMRESETVSQHVYDYHWLSEVDAVEFLRAAMRVAGLTTNE
ncbi:MAG: hypothetical protein ACRDRH_03525 [Pseudonocardia sp.]